MFTHTSRPRHKSTGSGPPAGPGARRRPGPGRKRRRGGYVVRTSAGLAAELADDPLQHSAGRLFR
ncbi:hypothetical protein, partial [Kitasatospora sp. NPDC047058]|uniref:hypothetical protein n=1 Tax=Kitasatospora sp. NPDC047058 TaxID=3155620 RepID=UPI0033F36B03